MIDLGLERAARYALHHQIRQLAIGFHVVNRNHIWMENGCRSLGFASKAFTGRCVVRQMSRQHFDRHNAMKLGVVGFQYDPHTTLANDLFDLVTTESTEQFGMAWFLQEG